MKLIAMMGLFALSFTACNQRYYSGGNNHVPVHTAAKQINVGGGIMITEKASGYQLQTSAALTNHIAVMLNGHHNSAVSTITTNNIEEVDNSYATYGEGAIGVFYPSGNKTVFEAYAGFGYGGIKNSYTNAYLSKISNRRLFLQPSISLFSENEAMSFSFSMRLSHVNVRVDRYDQLQNGYNQSEIDDVKQQPNLFLLEPSFQWKVGRTHQFCFQITNSRSVTVKRYPHDALMLGFSYNVRLKPKP